MAVPTKFKVSVPTVTVSSEPVSAPIVKMLEVAAVVTAVTLPFASTVITGIALELPYEPALTPEAASVVEIVAVSQAFVNLA